MNNDDCILYREFINFNNFYLRRFFNVSYIIFNNAYYSEVDSLQYINRNVKLFPYNSKACKLT